MAEPLTPETRILYRIYRERGAGGFSHLDGTIEFYTRINALLSPGMTVLDYGAGRAEWAEDPLDFRRNLRRLRGKVAEVIGADIDPVVQTNPEIDRAVVMPDLVTIPLADESVDLIVADHTFEHLDEPDELAAELTRVLRPGGWLCARTPNKWGYIAVATRLVPNDRHVSALRTLQPARKPMDVFPTRYRMNTRRTIKRLFPGNVFDDCTYYWSGEPNYFGRSRALAHLIRLTSTPAIPVMQPKLFVFLRKR